MDYSPKGTAVNIETIKVVWDISHRLVRPKIALGRWALLGIELSEKAVGSCVDMRTRTCVSIWVEHAI